MADWQRAQQKAEQQGLNRGDPGAAQDFVNRKRVGPQGVQKLKSQGVGGAALTPATTKLPQLPKLPTQTARRKRSSSPDEPWSKSPSTVRDEFGARVGAGHHPDAVFKQIISEIADHHAAGRITDRDAHRSANEALGRYMLSRRRTAKGKPRLDDLTQRRALNMVRDWMGWDEEHGERDDVPSGRKAYESGAGPMLHPDWLPTYQHPFTGETVPSDSGPGPHILFEGRPGWTDYAAADDTLKDQLRSIGVHAEPYNGYALGLYPHPGDSFAPIPPKEGGRRRADLRNDLMQAEGDEIKTIGEYDDYADDAMREGDPDAAAAMREVISDEEDHARIFQDQIKHLGRRKRAWMGWGPSVSPKRHRVAGWEWDNHLNGYISNKPRRFECACGEPVQVPDYHHCKCGKIWNTYVIGTGGDRHQAAAEKFIAREIPVRDNVIVANRRTRLRRAKEDGDWQPEPYDGPGLPPGAGDMYGTDDDVELQDLMDQVVELKDGQLAREHERRRSDPSFPGSMLSNVMWTHITNRLDGADDDPVDPTLQNYFNKVHGCVKHFWTPPELHIKDETCTPLNWDPDDSPGPDDPRIKGSRRLRRANGDDYDDDDPFPSDHLPKTDTRSKGVSEGKTSPDWHSRDHRTQRYTRG